MAKTKKKEVLSLEEKLERALVPAEEQPYDLPNNWCWIKHNIICQLGDGVKSEGDELPYLEVKYLRGAKEAEVLSKGKLIESGTKVILVDGENSGEVFDIFETGYMGSTFKTLVISSGVYDKYLLYFIHSKKDLLRNNKTGSAIPHLNKKLFFDLDFPLPPLTEQQRIVEQIENLFTRLEEVEEKLDDAINSILLQKEAVLKKAYSGELTKCWRNENSRLYSEWNIEEVSEKFDVTGGLQKKPDRAPKNNPIPYVTVANVFRNRIDLSEIKYFEVFDGELEKLRLKSKDILVVEGNGSGSEIGRCALWNNELPICIHQNHIIRMRRKLDNVVPEYVLYYLNSDEGKRIMKERAKTTTGLYNLSTGKIRTIPVPFAPYEEQKEIVRVLEGLMAKNEQTLECIYKVQAEIVLLKKAILAKAFHGELGTNNPDEESAIELLKQILEEVR